MHPSLFALALSALPIVRPSIGETRTKYAEKQGSFEIDAREQDEDDEAAFDAGVESEAASRWVWRGRALSRGPVVQSSVWVSSYGVTASLWSNVMIGADRPRASFAPSLTWTIEWGALTVIPGLVVFGGGGRDEGRTVEASVDAAFRVGGGFVLESAQSIDAVEHEGAWFGTFGVAWQRDVEACTLGARFDLAFADASFHRAYFGVRDTGASSAAVELSARRSIGDTFYLGMRGLFSALTSSSLRRAVEEPTLFVVGATFGAEL